MQHQCRGEITRSILRCLPVLTVLLSAPQVATGQNTPLISGAVAYLGGTNKGNMSFDPTVMPEVAFPVTQHFLFETRNSLLEAITPRNNKSDQTRLARNVLYLQLDYLATRHATLVAGKFLTPFATYNERLGPI